MSKARRTKSGSRAPAALNAVCLELNEDRATSSYPRTRSQTKAAQPLLKRKLSVDGAAKTSRPAKAPRKLSIDHGKAKSHVSPEAVIEGLSTDGLHLCESERTMWPVNVPRTMLFNFRVGTPPTQSYIPPGATPVSGRPNTRSGSSMFSSSGPQAMFDHTWRVTFVEPRTAHSFGRPTSPSFTSRFAASPIISHRVPADCPPSLPPPMAPAIPEICSSRSEQNPGSENVSPPQLTPIIPQDVVAANGAPPPPRGLPISLSPTTSGANRPAPSQLAHPHSRLYRIPTGTVASTPSSSLTTPHAQVDRARLPIYAPVPTPSPSHPLTGFASFERVPTLSSSHPASMQNALLLHHGPRFPMHAAPYVFAAPLHTFEPSPSPLFADPLHHSQQFSHNTGPILVQGCANDPLNPRFPQHAIHAHSNYTVSSLPYPQNSSHPRGDASFNAHIQPFSTLIPPLPLSFSNALVAPHRPHPVAVKPPWSALYESVKTAAGSPRKVARRKVGSAEYIEDQIMGSLSADAHSNEDPTRAVAGAQDMHRCPLCPRTFSLPHSLAIHLKWHWGASSLDWKRGISKRCKTIERAFSDAERRRKEAAQQQLVHGFPGMPSSLTMRDMHMNQGDSDSALSSAANPTSLSNDPSHSFIMPIVAQSSFDAFNFSRSPLESPLSANSSYISPNESHLPHAFPPATLASSSTTDAMYDSLPHTPDLLVDTGSSNGASTGRSSPIWSDHLFGPEEDADADAEGENDSGDVLGACLPVSEGIGRFYTTATTERHDPIRTDVTANSGTAEHVFHSRTASTFNSHFTSGPIPAARSRERESVSARVRPPLPRAPRLVPLRLPPMFYEDGTDNAQGDHEAVEEGDAFFAVRRARRPDRHGTGSADGLPPLSDLVSLHSLPELDVFGGLSIL